MANPKSAIVALLGKDPDDGVGDDGSGDTEPGPEDMHKAKLDAARVILEAIRADDAEQLVDALGTFCDNHEAMPDDDGAGGETTRG
jgi:hypothetical protein